MHNVDVTPPVTTNLNKRTTNWNKFSFTRSWRGVLIYINDLLINWLIYLFVIIFPTAPAIRITSGVVSKFCFLVCLLVDWLVCLLSLLLFIVSRQHCFCNLKTVVFRFSTRPFPSSLVFLFQNESKCETFHMKTSSACSFIFKQIKVIFITMLSHLDSLWNGGTRELGNGLLFTMSIINRTKYRRHTDPNGGYDQN